MISMSPEPLKLIFDALAFAAEHHRDQRRKNAEGSPYINHPIAMARILVAEGGVTDPTIICAALLHDTLGDTAAQAQGIEAHLGRDIYDSPPVGWSLARKQAYFDWALAVVNGLRGASPELEAAFDRVYALRPE